MSQRIAPSEGKAQELRAMLQGQTEALFFAGRPAEIPPLVEKAMRLNPRYPFTYLEEVGGGYCLTGRVAEAVATLKETIRRSPDMVSAYVGLASSYGSSGPINRVQMPRRWSRR